MPTNTFIITPHVFHEFYKHSQKIFGNQLKDFFLMFIDDLKEIKERDVSKNTLLEHELFVELEIGDHSLVCSCECDKTHAILHDDRKVCGKLADNREILTISLKEHILPWHWTTMT